MKYDTSNVIPTPGFERPPYHVEHFPIGACVCNRDGFNCLHFLDKPGAKFTRADMAEQICAEWNREVAV